MPPSSDAGAVIAIAAEPRFTPGSPRRCRARARKSSSSGRFSQSWPKQLGTRTRRSRPSSGRKGRRPPAHLGGKEGKRCKHPSGSTTFGWTHCETRTAPQFDLPRSFGTVTQRPRSITPRWDRSRHGRNKLRRSADGMATNADHLGGQRTKRGTQASTARWRHLAAQRAGTPRAGGSNTDTTAHQRLARSCWSAPDKSPLGVRRHGVGASRHGSSLWAATEEQRCGPLREIGRELATNGLGRTAPAPHHQASDARRGLPPQ